MQVHALVITGFGINCEEEMAAAYRLSGAEATIVHLNEILMNGFSIHDYDVLNFPGGFSFGDDIGSGRVLANKMKYKQLASGKTLLDEIQQFIADGKFILGICNGFQVLVKMGLLPNIAGDYTQEVTLTRNNSGKYEDRWVKLKVTPNTPTPFLKGMDTFDVPVRHGEGKLVLGEGSEKAIQQQKLNCLTYCDDAGNPIAEYPRNPNGAALNCAGLCDPTGQVFGLMPHPEAYLSLYNHPNWGQMKRMNAEISEDGEGLQIFKNIVHYIKERKGKTVDV